MMTDRNLFNADHGAGKGDKPRSKFDTNWSERFDAIRWKKSNEGFVRRGHKQTKRYGS